MAVPNSKPLLPHAVVRIGVRMHDAYPSLVQLHTVLVTTPAEFSLDELFAALNRVDETAEADCRRLPNEWQRTARRRLDLLRAPSMHAGDTVQLFSERGALVGSFRCADHGWEAIRG